MEKYILKESDKKNRHFKRFAREWAMQFLFQHDLNNTPDIETTIQNYLEQLDDSEIHSDTPDEKTFKKSTKFTQELIKGVLDNQKQIDETISSFSEKWTMTRMNNVDRNIMRVATYEMLFCKSVPPIVSINEAVEIGKTFGTVNSAAFINGILNSIKDTLDRPAREALA